MLSLYYGELCERVGSMKDADLSKQMDNFISSMAGYQG